MLGVCLAAAQAQAPEMKPWEEAALNALKAINSGNADQFLAWSHPQEQFRLKVAFMERLMAQQTKTPGPQIEQQLRPYGVKSLEELARMPETSFIAVSIPHQYAQTDALMREAMTRATFRIRTSEKVEEDGYKLYIDLHVPLPGQPLDTELVAVVTKYRGAWKYNGLHNGPPQ
jgi:hypothetical protein